MLSGLAWPYAHQTMEVAVGVAQMVIAIHLYLAKQGLVHRPMSGYQLLHATVAVEVCNV